MTDRSIRTTSPPLHLLRAFVTVARFGSATRAAEALHLTQGAVSKQVIELEELIGVRLFERVRRRLALTPEGGHYAAVLQPLLAQLDAAALELVAARAVGGGALNLSVLPTFAAKWLIPRLPDFQREQPQVALQFVPFAQGYDFSRPDLDCSIRFGDGHWPQSASCYLTGREVTVIGPPGRALAHPSDVLGQPLLHHISAPLAWVAWCNAHGLAGRSAPLAGAQLDQYQTLIRAVAAGMGLALVPRCLVEDDVRAGTVRSLPPDGYEDARGYHLCWPESRAHRQPLQLFRDWLLARVASEQAA